MQGLPPSNVVVPPLYEDGVKRLIEITKELQGNPPTVYEVTPLQVCWKMCVHSLELSRPIVCYMVAAARGVVSSLDSSRAGIAQDSCHTFCLLFHSVSHA